PDTEYIVISLLFKLISYLLEDNLLTFDKGKKSSQITYIKSGIAYINDNLTNKITLDNIADATGVSKAYFMRLFKKTTGSTVNSYIHGCRIEAAKKDILNGMSLSETAYRYNYSDAAHFSHTFKKYTGLTPSEYKSNNS
ncbi:MAG: helix-turn-helix transcriptional regulator, partial [Lachnospiraceae bacterium]|nr:helix-turn-helix transcriptional regulator [Lachnospiraceae bacterium]